MEQPVGFHSAAEAPGEAAGFGLEEERELWKGDGGGGDGGR